MGRQLAGCVLREILGAGGMGTVYRGEQIALSRPVAVKLLRPALAARAGGTERFEREARAAARLNHPNCIAIYDYGVVDSQPYLVMEYLEGRDLAYAIEMQGPLGVRRATTIALAVLDAIGEAHRHDVVHRDLKPENVLLGSRRDGTEIVKVADFGLAELVDHRDQRRLTEPGVVMATPGFASPEQVCGERCSARSDIYSAGSLLFEMLTGEPAFPGKTPAEIICAQITSPVPDPRKRPAGERLGDELAAVCMRALAMDPDARFESAEAMAEAIRAAVAKPATVRRPIAPSERPAGALPPTLPPPADTLGGVSTAADLVDAMRRGADRGVRSVTLVGGLACGKTTTLEACADRAHADGDLVVRVGPHPSGAPVAWHTAAAAVEALRFGAGSGTPDPVAAAGAAALAGPIGIHGLRGASASGAVAVLLARAIEHACDAAGATRVLLLVDDADRCDELSLRAIADLHTHLDAVPVVILLAARDAALAGTVGDGTTVSLPHAGGQARLEAVGDAIARLGAAARRWLQAAAVCGTESGEVVIAHVAGDDAEVVSDPALVRRVGGMVQMAPHVRDTVLASLPAEVRRELHARALDHFPNAPVEVVGVHAAGAAAGISSLIRIERAGDAALARGAVEHAVRSFETGLELARRAQARCPDEFLDSAVVSFGRKLGIALLRAGRPIEATGVLREAAEAEPMPFARAVLTIEVGRAQAARGRRAEAKASLKQALEGIRHAAVAPAVKAEAWLALAEARRDNGDAYGAQQALLEGCRLVTHERTLPGARYAHAIAEIAAKLADDEQTRVAARDALVGAGALAMSAGVPALAGLAYGAAAELDENLGRFDLAEQHGRRAMSASAEAGDVESLRRWELARRRWSQRGPRQSGRPGAIGAPVRALLVAAEGARASLMAAVLRDHGIETRTTRGAEDLLGALELAREAAPHRQLVVCAGAAGWRDLDLLRAVLELLSYPGAPRPEVAFVPRRADQETRSAAARLGARWVLDAARSLDDLAEIARTLRPEPQQTAPAVA